MDYVNFATSFFTISTHFPFPHLLSCRHEKEVLA